MKYRNIILFVVLFIFIITGFASAQEPTPKSPPFQSPDSVLQEAEPIEYNTLYASAYKDLWKINPYTGEFTEIGYIGYEGTDIAFDGKTLYGTSFTQLLDIEPTTGNGVIIGSIGYSGVNALVVALDGTMYAGTTNGSFLRINKETGAGTLIGNYGSGLASSGDLAVRYDGKIFASISRSGSSTDWLAEIDVNTGHATPIGDMGESRVYGLDFKDWSLYGVTDYGYVLEINPETGQSTQIGTKDADFWGLSTSGPALLGNITSPVDGYTTGPSSIMIDATAEYPGGKYINQVEFYVHHDRAWRSLGADEASPYNGFWQTPVNLDSQQVLLRIDVVGTDTQDKTQRASYAGGVRRVNFIRSLNNPDVEEYWVDNRAYLNQRSLNNDGNGDSKCNVSSVAMVLAIEGNINSDYLSMAKKANEMFSEVWPDPGVDKVYNALKKRISTAVKLGPINHTDGWIYLKNLIELGHPVIVDSRPGAATENGHYIVAVGYKEEAGENQIIAYDPFGLWRGTYESWYYNRRDPASHVGKWVYYDFEDFTGSEVYLIAAVAPECTVEPPNPPVCTSQNQSTYSELTESPTELSAPDLLSDEKLASGTYDGRSLKIYQYLPMLIK